MKNMRVQINPINNISITSGLLEGDDWPMHIHDFNELVVILDGSAMQCINGEKFFVSAGDVFVIKDNDAHGFQKANGLKLFNIGYKHSIFKNYESFLNTMPGFISLFYLQPLYNKQSQFESRLHLNINELLEVKTYLDLLKNEFKNPQAGCEIMVNAYFLQLAVLLSRKFSSYRLSLSRCLGSLSKAISYIETHYAEKLTLKQLAALSDIPVNSFLKEFKAAFNTSPIHYIIELKIRKACELLIHESYNITEISSIIGFSDSNYFSRIFKERIGLSPSDYRKSFTI